MDVLTPPSLPFFSFLFFFSLLAGRPLARVAGQSPDPSAAFGGQRAQLRTVPQP